MRYYMFLISLLPLVADAQTDNDEVRAGKDIAVVETEYGKVRGYIYHDTYIYKGIPYAKAERFMPPEKVQPWTDVRFMGYYGATCPLDFEPIKARGNGSSMFALQNDWGYPHEDCLSLNIWTPGISDNMKRPVMMWIHGGGYEYGSSHELPFYDGTNLSRTGNIVYVSVNHRLNILGFLDLSQYGDKYKYSPNLGLLDLVAALKWIRQNISQFGGDPENITLFGQSGGGGKITALLNSPVADGLFQKAVIQSGSFTREYADPGLAGKVSAKVLDELKIDPANIDDIQKVTYDELMRAGKRALAGIREEIRAGGATVPRLGWGPVRDDYFLPFPVFGAEVLALCNDVSIMIGTTKTEFASGASYKTGEDMDATRALIKEIYKDRADAYLEAVISAYPNTVKPSDYLDIDFMFRSGAVRDAIRLVRGGHKNIYMYLFEWESPVNDGSFKAMHCMELPFVFNNILLGKELTGGDEEAYKLAETVSAAWISFARNGDPNVSGLPLWPVYTSEMGATMIINNASRVGYHHDKNLLELIISDQK